MAPSPHQSRGRHRRPPLTEWPAQPLSPETGPFAVTENTKSSTACLQRTLTSVCQLQPLCTDTCDVRANTYIVAELRKIAWSGIPNDVRPVAWQLLLVRVLKMPCDHVADRLSGLFTTCTSCSGVYALAQTRRVRLARQTHICPGTGRTGPANLAPD